MRGKLIKRVVFSLDGKKIQSQAKGPYVVFVRALPGAHNVKARVTFKDATRAKTLALGYRACADAVLRPDERPARSSPDEARSPHPAGRRAGGGDRARPPALAASPRARRPSVPVTQPLVILLQDHVARATASTHARVIEPVAAVRPLTKVRTVLPVMGAVKGKDGNRWVHVRLPGRPSGHTGWILADQTIRSSTEWRIVVTVSARRVTIYRDGLVVRVFPAVVPKPSTPTPYGQFFVEEALAISPRTPAARSRSPSAPARTSSRSSRAARARSRIHGTDGLSDPLGSAASHGCIRISPSAITWLSSRIGGGVPVTVER